MKSVRPREVWKSDLLTQISHEMRTPLTSIIGYAEVMLSDPKLPDKAKNEYTTIIRDAGKRLSSFLDTFIESEVVEHSRQLSENRREDITVLAQNAFDRVIGLAMAKCVTMTLRSDSDLVVETANPEQLMQIFENLLANAIDLAPRDGQIDFKARRFEGRVQIEITNSDHGFLSLSPSAAGKRFRWVQSPGIEIRHEGLGLAFAKHVVELEGGLLNILSTQEGLTFTLQFPSNSE